MVAQQPHDLGERPHHRDLEQSVTGVRGQRAEHIGPQHRYDHGAVAPRRLSGEPAVVAVGPRRVALVHERHHLVAQVVLIAPGARRVQELRASVTGPGIDEHDHRRRAVARGEHRVQAIEQIAPRTAGGCPTDPAVRCIPAAGRSPERASPARHPRARAAGRPSAAAPASRRADCRRAAADSTTSSSSRPRSALRQGDGSCGWTPAMARAHCRDFAGDRAALLGLERLPVAERVQQLFAHRRRNVVLVQLAELPSVTRSCCR